MSKQTHPINRRKFIRVLGNVAAVLPFAGTIPVQATEMPKLSVDDATAKALGYVNETATAGQRCNNCNFWQGGDASWAGCPLFPGKSVNAKGWCKSWIKKA